MFRPPLTSAISANDFRSFYWLKAELLAFCRAQQLSTHGSKQELAERIATFLASGERVAPSATTTRKAPAMPTTLARDSVIGAGWRCNQDLRAFFRTEIGPRFHFDQRMRDFIKHGEGKTLNEAIVAWQQPRETTTIAPQFEYNQHIRTFFAAHPDATRAEALQAWNEQKAQRRNVSDDEG